MIARLLGQCEPLALDWQDHAVAAALPAVGDRMRFVGAQRTHGGLLPIRNQQSGGQRALADADWIIRRAPGDPAIGVGASVSAVTF